MADNYLEKKMEEFRQRASRTSNTANRKPATTLNKLLVKNRCYTHFDNKVVVRESHLRSIAEVCNKIEFLGGMVSDDFMFDYIIDSDSNTESTSAKAFISVKASLEKEFCHINLGMLIQSIALRATEMGLNCSFLNCEESSNKIMEVKMTVGKGIR